MTDVAGVAMGESAGAHAAEHHDYIGRKLGMWLFLFTELLLFGGMFLLYSVQRDTYPRDFHTAAMELNTVLGTLNTIVLLTSSMTMAIAISALQKGQRVLSVRLVLATVAFAGVFLIIKYFEWSAKIHHGTYPGSESMALRTPGEQMFFSLYYVMTGLHGIHVVVGMIILIIMVILIRNRPMVSEAIDVRRSPGLKGARLALQDSLGNHLIQSGELGEDVDQVRVQVLYKPSQERIQPKDFDALENSGLYWHLVDLIWIFLFPLFYLIT